MLVKALSLTTWCATYTNLVPGGGCPASFPISPLAQPRLLQPMLSLCQLTACPEPPSPWYRALPPLYHLSHKWQQRQEPRPAYWVACDPSMGAAVSNWDGS